MPTISNQLISASLDEAWPKLYRVERLDTGGHLAASGPDVPLRLELNGRLFDQTELYGSLVESQADSATYLVSVLEWQLDLFFRFALDGQEIVFTIPEVRENGSVQLERLRLVDHRLISGLATSGDSFFRHAGRRLNWSRAWCPGAAAPWEDWGSVGGALPEPGLCFAHHATVWNDTICAAFWCSIYIEPLVVELSPQGQKLPERAGRFSVSAGTWHHRLRGTPAAPFELRLAVLADYNDDGKIDWADAACWEGDRTYQPNPLYKETLFYKLWLDSLFLPKPHFTYADCLEVIKRLHRISGGVRQIVYLFGWQGLGHDTGFPSHNEFDPRVGTREELGQLIEKAKAYNCIVSLHGNFDDAYEKNPGFNPDLLSGDPDGPKVWFNNFLVNTPVYSINHTLANEAGYNEERIEQLTQNVPLHQTIHLDAHRCYNETWLDNGDFISAECEVQRGLIPVRDGFRRRGLDLTIEGTDSETRGIYGWAWIQASFLHPYATLMTHGRFPGLWRGGMNRDCIRTRPEGHAIGIPLSQLDQPNQPEAQVTASFYQDWMYTEILRRKVMTSYRNGDWDMDVEARYKDNTWVKAGTNTPLEAWYEGIPIARGESRFLPWRDDTIFVFSPKAETQEWTLPESWTEHPVRLAPVHADSGAPLPAFTRTGRTIHIDVPAETPLRLERV